MSNFFIALITSVALAAWLYNKFSRRTGVGNNQNAIIGAIACAVFIFIVLFISLNWLMSN